MTVTIKKTHTPINPEYYVLPSGRQVGQLVTEMEMNYNCGTAVVYLQRAGKKVTTPEGQLEDVEKAIRHLEMEADALRSGIKGAAIKKGIRAAKRKETALKKKAGKEAAQTEKQIKDKEDEAVAKANQAVKDVEVAHKKSAGAGGKKYKAKPKSTTNKSKGVTV